MSKIGRRPIPLGDVSVEVAGTEIRYKGAKASGAYILPTEFKAQVDGQTLLLSPVVQNSATNRLWGLHRALVANKIQGAGKGFERQLRIVGLGFKAVLQGKNLQLSLGFSHKIDYEMPDIVTVEIDKTGQLLTLKSFDKIVLGQACSHLRGLRPPEPYKGVGIQYADEIIIRKAGKAKSAA